MDDPKPDKQSKHQPDEPPVEASECRWPWLEGALRRIRRHAVELGVICAILALVAPLVALVVKGIFFSPDQIERLVPSGGSPSLVPQVKRTGVQAWGASTELPEDGGRIDYGIRFENTSPRPLTGLVARAALPEVFKLLDAGCRYGIDRVAATPCPGSIVADEGVELPDLQPGSWVHLVFGAAVPADVPGSNYLTTLRVASDQAAEMEARAAVRVPATEAEEAVRALYSQTEGEREFWGGTPEMAARSKRLLIARWAEVNFEHAHPFEGLPGRPATLSDLVYEQVRQGRVTEVRARVAGRPRNLSRNGGVVKQSYELVAAGERARLHCYTPRPVGHLLKGGEGLEVKAIPIAWSPHGSEAELAMALCPAVRLVRTGKQRQDEAGG